MKSIIILIFLSFPLISMAQTDSVSLPRFEFSFSIGTANSGLDGDFEKAMKINGLGETMTGFLGIVKHPFSNTGFGATGVAWIFSANYKMSNEFFLGMSIANSPIGMTSGYRTEGFKSTFQYMYYTLFEIVPTATVKVGMLNLCAGPAFFITKTSVTDQVGDDYDDYIFHFGLVLDASFQYPAETMFFGFAKFRARILSKDNLGPYNSRAIGSANINTIQSFEVNYSSTYLGLGIGMRL